MNWFRFHCRRARKFARLASAGCLTEPERAWLKRHSGVCSDCRYYAAELDGIRQQLQVWEGSLPGTKVPTALSDQWQRAIQAEATTARRAVRPPDPLSAGQGWLGLGRAIPVSLVLIWLATIGIHLNTPPVSSANPGTAVPTIREVRVVMEWLITTREPV